PMFGDYEAQRHWQEVTYNLPPTEWYVNSSHNNLGYWGLDYPPLTAYHSYVCGWIASHVNTEWISLGESHGFESDQHKVFMRCTVIVADIIVYYSAVWAIWRFSHKAFSNVGFILAMFYPGLILIDHGHFQYNCISLGLMLWAMVGFQRNYDVVGSIFFCLALNYKQMELYHALPVFCYLLGKSLKLPWGKCIIKLFQLGIAVVLSFLLLWLPFLASLDNMGKVVARLFPFDRGLFEDKVANVWCAISPVIKVKQLMGQTSILRLCSLTTLLLSLPSCVHLLRHPNMRIFKLSMVNVSLIFFLFSFQVHEKSILISAVSALLLYGELPTYIVTGFLHMSGFSMLPLLAKDGLSTQLFTTSILFIFLSNFNQPNLNERKLSTNGLFRKLLCHVYFWPLVLLSFTFGVMSLTIPPPPRYPDIFPVVNAIVSCGVFLAFGLWELHPMCVAAKIPDH
uniref:Alpha-1,3-glucosyltransferase n=1 Tax=Ciona savignyi TaxID=51511 RepID=H2Y783_CIOSA